MRLTKIGSPEASQVIRELQQEQPVVFAGSAISIWQPSELPTGQDFMRALYDSLFDPTFAISSEERPVLLQLFDEMPFEHLLEVCPSPDKASDLIIELYGKNKPNPVHRALARAIRQGIVSSIITTNYDCCLESALAEEDGRPVQKVVTEDDLLRHSPGSDSARYFKIHGSIEPGLERTAIRTLAEECLLPKWKRQFLREILQNRAVVFLGYSGRDFELCPEIARVPIKRMVWISRYPASPSVNSEALLEEANGELLYGDMNDLLKEWLDAERANLGGNPTFVRDAIRKRFTSDVLCAWRLAVLLRIGAPSLALRTIDAGTCNLDPSIAERQRAHAEVSAGRYLTAVHRFLMASVKEFRSKGRCAAADILLDACDAYRIAGAMIRAWLSFGLARLLACKQNRAKLFLKLALLLYVLHEFSASGFLLKFRAWLHLRLIRVLKECSREALATGNWLDFQQSGLIAHRMKVPLSELAEGDFYPPPDPRRGYQQLGYFLAQSMTILDDLIERPPEGRSERERYELEKMLTKHLQFCSILGIAPQAWKLQAAGRACFTLDRNANADFISSMVDAFRSCEYKPLMRRFWRRRFRVLDSAL